MNVVCAYQFEVEPRAGQAGLECLAGVRDEVGNWICTLFKAAGAGEIQLPAPRESASPHPEHHFGADWQQGAGYGLAALEWELSLRATPDVGWRFSFLGAWDGQGVQVALTVDVLARSPALRPVHYRLDDSNPFHLLPSLVMRLGRAWECRFEGQPLPTRPRALRVSHLDQFVRETLLHPDRALPVLMLALDGPLQMEDAQLQNVQDQLVGLALVAALRNRTATARFAELLGPALSLEGGVVRLYWPGLTRQSPPDEQPLFTAEQVRQAQDGPVPVERHIQDRLLAIAAHRFQPGRVVRAAEQAQTADQAGRLRQGEESARRLAAAEAELAEARRERDEARRWVDATQAELDDARAEAAALRAARQPTLDELAAELERAWDENAGLVGEVEAARRRAAELEADLRNYRENWELLWGGRAAPAPPKPPEAERSFASVADALQAAAEEFADVLTVWDAAAESARESTFATPAKVYQALRAIAEVGRDYFLAQQGGPPLGPMEQAFHRRVPFKYTPFESMTTLGLFGADRVFRHRGQGRQMQRHLTLGGGTTNNCLQIYFEFEEVTRRVLVGHCGRHLRYSGQRT